MKGGCLMDSLSSMNNAMVYIEEHLTEDIDYSEVSKIAYCSEWIVNTYLDKFYKVDCRNSAGVK